MPNRFDPTKPVQTRDGRKARILATDLKDPNYPILAAVTLPRTGLERPIVYTSEGKWSLSRNCFSESDLINIPEEKYLNLWKSSARGYFTTGPFDSLAKAKRTLDKPRFSKSKFIQTIKVENETD